MQQKIAIFEENAEWTANTTNDDNLQKCCK